MSTLHKLETDYICSVLNSGFAVIKDSFFMRATGSLSFCSLLKRTSLSMNPEEPSSVWIALQDTLGLPSKAKTPWKQMIVLGGGVAKLLVSLITFLVVFLRAFSEVDRLF